MNLDTDVESFGKPLSGKSTKYPKTGKAERSCSRGFKQSSSRDHQGRQEASRPPSEWELMMNTFDAVLQRVEHSLKWICMALVIGLAVLVFSSVLFRYLLNNPLEWADEVVGFFILGLTYFGSAVACGRRSQIYVEILESALKKNPGTALTV
jgi:hypothetical protein